MTLFDIIAAIQSMIEALVPLIIGFALIGVLWGLALYAFKAGDPDEQKRGRMIMFWGVIVLFVMVAVWGLVAILQETVFGTTDVSEPPTLPELEEGSE